MNISKLVITSGGKKWNKAMKMQTVNAVVNAVIKDANAMGNAGANKGNAAQANTTKWT